MKQGDVVTNGSSAGVLQRRERNGRWKADGWVMMNIGIGPFDGSVGMTSFVPDYLLSGWRVIEVGEWTPLPVAIPHRAWVERYVWVEGVGDRLRRELAPAEEISLDATSDHGLK